MAASRAYTKNMLAPNHAAQLAPLTPTPVYDSYWRLAYERQEIFFSRVAGFAPPWTLDPILAKHKFTNAYRASDRVSQYLIRSVIYSGDQSPDEVFFRTILFKIFNRIGTWELLKGVIGHISSVNYDFSDYDKVLTDALNNGERIFSAAYIMPSGESSYGETKKHRNYLRMLERMMEDDLPSRIKQQQRMRDVFELLHSYPGLGDFLAYQYTIDLNYSTLTDFSEMEFVMPGPGAIDGIHKCFSSLGGLSEVDVIRIVTERQEEEFRRLGLRFRNLWGRPLQLIDCQNVFCEVAKYARLAHPEIRGVNQRSRIKQLYDPYEGRRLAIEYWYPPKWGLNERIAAERQENEAKRGKAS
jgi:hypothetical protein